MAGIAGGVRNIRSDKELIAIGAASDRSTTMEMTAKEQGELQVIALAWPYPVQLGKNLDIQYIHPGRTLCRFMLPMWEVT